MKNRTASVGRNLSPTHVATLQHIWLGLATALMFCLLTTSAQAQQTGSITGVITDAQTGETLPGVNVSLQETTKGAATDGNGVYTIENIAPGTYQVVASFLGFRRNVVPVTVSAGQQTTQNFALAEDLIGLDEIVVTGQGAGMESSMEPRN